MKNSYLNQADHCPELEVVTLLCPRFTLMTRLKQKHGRRTAAFYKEHAKVSVSISIQKKYNFGSFSAAARVQ